MKLLCSFGVVIVASVSMAQTAWVNGKQVPINFPKDEVPVGFSASDTGLKNEIGQIVHPWPFWADLKAKHAALDMSKAKPLPILIVIPARHIGVHFDDQGYPHFTNGIKMGWDYETAEADAARLAAGLRVLSHGEIDPHIDVQVDTAASEEPGEPTLAARANTVSFETPDPSGVKSYRQVFSWNILGEGRLPLEQYDQLMGLWRQSATAVRASAMLTNPEAPDWNALASEAEATSDEAALAASLVKTPPAPSTDLQLPEGTKWETRALCCFEKSPDDPFKFLEVGPNRLGMIELRLANGFRKAKPDDVVSFDMTVAWKDEYEVEILGEPGRVFPRKLFRPGNGVPCHVAVSLKDTGLGYVQGIRIYGHGDRSMHGRTPITLTAPVIESGKPEELPYVIPEAEKVIPGLKDTTDESVLLAALEAQNYALNVGALQRLTVLKSPKLLPQMVEHAKSANQAVAIEACQAIISQGTPESKAALIAVMDKAAFDHTMYAACKAVISAPSPDYIAQIGSTLASGAWTARREAVRALAAIKTPLAMQTLAIFINDPEPNVRLEVVRLADLTDDTVQRRVLYAMANDSSEAVRVAAVLNGMTAEPGGKVFKEATSRLSDDSYAVRAGIVAGAPTKEELRPFLIQASHDPSATVRAAAVTRLAQLPNGVTPKDLASQLKDTDFRVQWALADLVASGKLKLTADESATLAGSKYPAVRAKLGAR